MSDSQVVSEMKQIVEELKRDQVNFVGQEEESIEEETQDDVEEEGDRQEESRP